MSGRAPLLLGTGLFALACAEPVATERPDVLLVTIDTLRADHCSAYGYRRDTTPALTRLAAEGVLFEVAYAPVGATCPSHATLFTASHPITHGVVRNGLDLVESRYTLAELLRENGYTTAAFVSSFPVSHRFGFAQGFEHFDDRFEAEHGRLQTDKWTGEPVTDGFDRPADATAAAALDWLTEHAGEHRPLFVWVHLFDPHSPCRPPEPYLSRFTRPGADPLKAKIARYDGAIAFADDAWARVLAGLEGLGRDRGTLVVVTADHGEGLNDHGYPLHNRYTYEEELRVPLVARWRGRIPAGVRATQPAHLVDVLPTVAAALGLDAPRGDGIDLGAHWRGAAPDADRPLFLLRPYYPQGRPRYDQVGPGHGLRMGRWKYFEAPDEGLTELYDLDRDPGEKDNLAADEVERVSTMSSLVDEWLADQRARAPDDMPAERAEDLEGLRELGYLEGHAEPDDE